MTPKVACENHGPGLPSYGVQYTWPSNSPILNKHEFKSDASTVLARTTYTLEDHGIY